mmetsp:Transcript_16280/g.24630  ORF Transcript_16280/g.24630 Transcript_16280/m.24630 type:complete len:210 (+) Transcript_16280:1071-1700(+)|eukprot:CAMPEP_0178905008 /NCGR_PEP_ID=MMETSP0786-20121207/6016_1 /TAXON_ID=186022 /ORGANISM="Thalassionema frauenfeldii, Strain CCMP 1798" /LENGTH=209 /DNA_ID=CAMNT_0020576527 /DNA_START=1045 /DNA_END=1674 /DNA_ORIENTATION=+
MGYLHNRLDPLHTAAWNGNEDSIRSILLDENLDIDVKDSWGYTALIRACENGHDNVVKLLLEHGANTKEHDLHPYWERFNETALHKAVSHNYEGVTKLLLEYGADVEATNYEGLTAIDIAKDNGYENLLPLLRKRRIDRANKILHRRFVFKWDNIFPHDESRDFGIINKIWMTEDDEAFCQYCYRDDEKQEEKLRCVLKEAIFDQEKAP